MARSLAICRLIASCRDSPALPPARPKRAFRQRARSPPKHGRGSQAVGETSSDCSANDSPFTVEYLLASLVIERQFASTPRGQKHCVPEFFLGTPTGDSMLGPTCGKPLWLSNNPARLSQRPFGFEASETRKSQPSIHPTDIGTLHSLPTYVLGLF